MNGVEDFDALPNVTRKMKNILMHSTDSEVDLQHFCFIFHF